MKANIYGRLALDKSNNINGELKVSDLSLTLDSMLLDGNEASLIFKGQEVDIDFNSGVVSVDGVALDEPYVNTPTNEYEGVDFPQIVPPGCVFVLGDNRNLSKDSRSWEIGMIDKREILGKALLVALPGADEAGRRNYNRIGVVG